MGKLVNSIRSSTVSALGNGGWKSIEMVHRYAHLAPNHLTEHAREIDDIFGDDVPNMSHMENKEEIKKRNALIYKWRPAGFNINNQQYDLIELIVFITLHIPPNVPP